MYHKKIQTEQRIIIHNLNCITNTIDEIDDDFLLINFFGLKVYL